MKTHRHKKKRIANLYRKVNNLSKSKGNIRFDKVLIVFLLILSFVMNFQPVNAFDFPVKNDQAYVSDNAQVLEENIIYEVSNKCYEYDESKNIDAAVVTISESVGDKEEYTKSLKEWWEIGINGNGLIIAIYPNSKDTNEIIIDDSIGKYIDKHDVARYKKILEEGVNNNTINESLLEVINDIDSKLVDYSKSDYYIQVVKDFLNSFKFNLTRKKKSYVSFNLKAIQKALS